MYPFTGSPTQAIQALQAQLHKIAFDANLFDRGLCGTEHARHCSQERKKILKAIQALQPGATQLPLLKG